MNGGPQLEVICSGVGGGAAVSAHPRRQQRAQGGRGDMGLVPYVYP